MSRLASSLSGRAALLRSIRDGVPKGPDGGVAEADGSVLDPPGDVVSAGGPDAAGHARLPSTAAIGILATCLSACLVLAAPDGWPKLLGAMLFACTCGAAATCWIHAGDTVAQVGTTIVVGLAGLAMCGACMIWVTAWHPLPLFLILCVCCVISCGARLRTHPSRSSIRTALPALRAAGRGMRARRRLRPRDAPMVILILGLISWAVGVASASPGRISQIGLLLGVNAWIPLAIVLLLLAFTLELSAGRPRGWLLAMTTTALLVSIYAAVPLIFNGPEYSWVYKHVGIISSFQRYGRVTDPTDIYQQWPTLFAGVGIISSLAHLNAVWFAQWAPLAFELADAILVFAIARTLLQDRRAVWLALVLYEGLVAWVGQDYLSPQAFAYTLWLGTILMILRWLRTHPSRTVALVRWLQNSESSNSRVRRAANWLRKDLPPEPEGMSDGKRRLAVALVLLVYVAIVTAHQLTPYMAIVSVASLSLLSLIRPGWLIFAFAALAGAFLALHYHLVVEQYGGLFGGDPISNAGGAIGVGQPSAAQLWSARGTYLVMAVMWLWPVGILIRTRRSPGKLLTPALLAYSPFLVLLASNYGGEAIYRVFLFSAPWCAILIAGWVTSFRFVLIRNALMTAAVIGIVLLSVQGQFGTVTANGFTHSEVAASEWVYRHVPSKALVVFPSNNFPTLEAANYNRLHTQVMPADAQFGASWMNEGHLNSVKKWISGFGYSKNYIVVSNSMRGWAGFYNVTPGYRKLERALRRGFLNATPVYRNSTTTVYRIKV